jgi:hypothetical protein
MTITYKMDLEGIGGIIWFRTGTTGGPCGLSDTTR